jgi:hypothetical protein
MAKVKEIVGGYTVPGGRGGAAVAYACQLVNQRPGIRQSEIHELSSYWSGLNFSTASWIASPGPKSPGGILWDRRKEGRIFKCYPNELTDKLGDPRIRLQADILKEFDKGWNAAGRPVPGSLVTIKKLRWSSADPQEYAQGLLLGFTRTNRVTYGNEEAQAGGREYLLDLETYNDGTFWVHPLVLAEGRKKSLQIHDIVKDRSCNETGV